jgi:glycogen operon protein
MASLLLSQGVPMICGGDEMGRTQRGNNNAYCQDNELSWLDWELDAEQQDFLEFTRRCVRIWRENPVLQRRKFFQGRQIRGSQVKDIAWFEPAGHEMADEAWNAHFVRSLAVRLAGDMLDEVDENGDRLAGDTLLMLLNAHHEPIPFLLPAAQAGFAWEVMLDTTAGNQPPKDAGRAYLKGDRYELNGRSMTVMRARPRPTR